LVVRSIFTLEMEHSMKFPMSMVSETHRTLAS
jgi:hypothetical protein